jgi:regulator of ribonuclease activity A
MSAHPAVTDLCDAFADRLQIAEPILRDFGGRDRFAGRLATLKVLDDNALVRTRLAEPGQGRVLVIDGGGSLRCALLGGNLGALARNNGWDGVVVHGCVRDTAELSACDLGVKALAPHPRRSDKRGAGERDVPVHFAGVTFVPGAWLYADRDGLVVAEAELKVP